MLKISDWFFSIVNNTTLAVKGGGLINSSLLFLEHNFLRYYSLNALSGILFNLSYLGIKPNFGV